MMKHMRKAILRLGSSVLFLCVATANAAVVQVTVDTSSITGASAWLAFDLVDGGDGPTPSSVVIDPFVTDGTLGANVIPVGGVSGTLPGPVTLDDSSFFNEYLQDITLGNSITFTFETSGALASPTPDGFSLFVLAACNGAPAEPTAANGCVPFESLLPTSDPAGALFLFNIGGGFQGGGPYSSAVTVAELPEPGSLALALGALFAFGAARRSPRRSASEIA